jgi:hypothetical protein
MSSHTPGPWRVERPDHDPNAFDVYGSDGARISRGYWSDKARADALLVAAAPALLAAAVNALTRLDREDAEKVAAGKPPPHHGVIGSVNDQLRAAIATAKGGK